MIKFIRAFIFARSISKKHGWSLLSQESFRIFLISLHAGIPLLTSTADKPSTERLNFQGEMKDVISGIIKATNNKSAIVCFEWINNEDFNAFALKLSDERENYLIVLNTGIDVVAEKIMNSKNFIDACRKLKNLDFLDDKTLGSFAHYLVICFIFFHELGHVIRGHSNYRRHCGASNPSVFWANKPNTDSLPDVGVRVNITECDADNYAARSLVACTQKLTNMVIEKHPGRVGSRDSIFDELASLSCVCMATVFNYFDTSPHGQNNPYPLAPIRLTVALGTFSDQLVENGVQANKALNISTRALDIAEYYLKSSDWKIQPLEFGKAAERWHEDVLPEIRKYSLDSHKYTKFTTSKKIG